MANCCNCKLTIKGPNRQAALDKLKNDKPYVEDDKHYTVYFDLENIVPVPEGVGDGYRDWADKAWGCRCVYPDGQEHKTLEDADVIHFTSPWSPPLQAILALSAMFPENTFLLEEDGEDVPTGATLFQGGRSSLHWMIPNHNSNTGKTATLYEIFVSVLRRTGDLQKALTEVQRVKAERLNAADDTPDSTSPDPTYNSALDAEVKAIVAPRTYDVTMIPADEEQIADLLTDGAQVAKIIAERPARADVESPVLEVETVF